MESYYNIIETLVAVVCVDKGKLKILLRRKQNEPYKGYWILLGDFLKNNETLEENVNKIIFNNTNIKHMNFNQSYISSDLNRDKDERILAITFVAFTTKELVQMKTNKQNLQWFELTALPKLGYDHNVIIKQVYHRLLKQIVLKDKETIYNLFPNEFTLPELHEFFETNLNKKIDRRNFRKKLLTSEIIKETGVYSNNLGRPSKLYRFKESDVNINVK